MYPAIQANIDRIAHEAFDLWLTGSSTDSLIDKRLTDSNMIDWIGDARSALSQLINDHHTNNKLNGY
jgi:hypothetical protein